MPKIETVILRSYRPDQQRRFYSDILGMNCYEDGTVGYGEEEARLSFPQAGSNYVSRPNDLYWKIALAVPNIELACQQLTEFGIEVGPPRQFEDVGYLAHFVDPEGFTIELIEHYFKGNRPDKAGNSNLLGGGAHLNLLTLRTVNIEKVIETCQGWGMKMLCIQPLESYGFTLYFFAFTVDNPPSPDLRAVINREWLYQRRYTILEVQHLHNAESVLQPTDNDAAYAGTIFSGLTIDSDENELVIGLI